MKEAAAIFDGTQAILAEDLPPNQIANITIERNGYLKNTGVTLEIEPLGATIQNLPPQIYDYEFWEEPGQLD